MFSNKEEPKSGKRWVHKALCLKLQSPPRQSQKLSRASIHQWLLALYRPKISLISSAHPKVLSLSLSLFWFLCLTTNLACSEFFCIVIAPTSCLLFHAHCWRHPDSRNFLLSLSLSIHTYIHTRAYLHE